MVISVWKKEKLKCVLQCPLFFHPSVDSCKIKKALKSYWRENNYLGCILPYQPKYFFPFCLLSRDWGEVQDNKNELGTLSQFQAFY